jgi:hypothetical protein
MAVSPTGMSRCQTDITADPDWQDEQIDRLLAFEVLQAHLHAKFQPMEAERLADKISLDKGISYRIVQSIQSKLNARQ